jgi:cytochrome c-type biogenesis protein CcmH/NrfG
MTGVTAQEPSRPPSSALLTLALLGLGAGLSPFFFAYYDASVWVPIGLVLVAACAIGVVAYPLRPGAPGALALGGLFGLGIWSVTSTLWAESVEKAVVSGNRWLAYGALLLLLLALLRSELHSGVLLGAAGLGVVAVAVSVLVRLLGTNPGTLFLEGRLNLPLGYINGEGCLFAIGFWLCMAVAESRRALLAGTAAGIATLMACLALLSQSRGTAIAMLGSLVVVVAFAPGRTRRAYGLLVVAGGVALAAPALLRIYDRHATGAFPVEAGHAAGQAMLLGAAAAGVIWALLTTGWELARSRRAVTSRAGRTGSWLLVIPLVFALAVAVGSAHRIERDISRQWHAFTHLAPPPASGSTASQTSESRLLSGVGNRYDYWRVAWRIWRAHPVLGVGAGNYLRSYDEDRATTEEVEQPHSIELQALSELGVVGALLLAVFLVGVAWGALRMRPEARRSPVTRSLMVGAVGAFVAWLVQTSVDWMHLLPGLTAIALVGAAVLLRPRIAARKEAGVRSRLTATVPGHPGIGRALASRRALVLATTSAVVATLAVAGASLSRQGLSELYRSRAQSELGDAHPETALTDANRSLNIDSDAVETYYVKAAALARVNQATEAETVLRQALAHEPNDFVTWVLLGDIAVREGRLRVARHEYEHARQLNPLNPTLTELSADPAAALR